MRFPLFRWMGLALAAGRLLAADPPPPAAVPSVVSTPAGAAAKPWWQAGRWHPPAPNPKAAVLPRISVRGNHFTDPIGATVLFRGLAIADPDKIAGQGYWGRELFAAVKATGATIVRIPVHPVAWRARTPAGYLALLDQAVDWCTDLGLYVLIDWHSIGNLRNGMFQAPMYDTSVAETLNFWRLISLHFHGHHTVAFYELFNEPTHLRGMLGTMSWTDWRQLNEEMIGVIRASDQEAIPLVAGFDWAYDLDPIRYEPVRAEGIGYVVHPYANKRPPPWEPKWEENFAFAAEHYPVVATEFGFALKPDEVIDDNHYANRITRFLEQHGISWVGWVFDPNWGPPLLKSFDGFALNPAGEFFKQALHRPPAPPPPKGE